MLVQEATSDSGVKMRGGAVGKRVREEEPGYRTRYKRRDSARQESEPVQRSCCILM